MPARALFSGVPAKLIKENIGAPNRDPAEMERRFAEVVASFHRFYEDRLRGRVAVLPLSSAPTSGAAPETVFYSFSAVDREQLRRARTSDAVTVIDLERLYVVPGGAAGKHFADFLATYGVRLSAVDAAEL